MLFLKNFFVVFFLFFAMCAKNACKTSPETAWYAMLSAARFIYYHLIAKNRMIYNRIFLFFSIFVTESLIARFPIQGELGMSANWTQYVSRPSATDQHKIEFEYRVMCQANYYGPGCATLCRERNDSFGHFACLESGERICLTGWQGPYCTERKCFLQFYFFLRRAHLSWFNDQTVLFGLLCFCLLDFGFYYNDDEENERKGTQQSLKFKYQSLTHHLFLFCSVRVNRGLLRRFLVR